MNSNSEINLIDSVMFVAWGLEIFTKIYSIYSEKN